MSFSKYGLITCSLLLLAGCSSSKKSLYAWYHYEPELYAGMQGKDPQKQLKVLEADEQKAQGKGRALPPGFHAHLGYLYAKLGQTAQAQTEFVQEKTLFPESAPYMDFVLKNMGASSPETNHVDSVVGGDSGSSSTAATAASGSDQASQQAPSQGKTAS